jgi:hypothetical protein
VYFGHNYIPIVWFTDGDNGNKITVMAFLLQAVAIVVIIVYLPFARFCPE